MQDRSKNLLIQIETFGNISRQQRWSSYCTFQQDICKYLEFPIIDNTQSNNLNDLKLIFKNFNTWIDKILCYFVALNIKKILI